MRKVIYTIFLILVMLQISSCASSPEYIEMNGIKFAVESSPERVKVKSGLAESVFVNMEKTSKSNEYRVDLKISEEKQVRFIYIDNKNASKGISKLNAMPNSSSLDVQRAIVMLGGDKYGARDYSKEFKEADDERNKTNVNKKIFDGDTFFCICSDDCIPDMPAYGTWHMVSSGEAGFIFSNLALMEQADRSFEMEQAEELLRKTLVELEFEDVSFDEISFDQNTELQKDGVWTINFQPVVEGIPMVTNAVSGRVDNTVIEAFGSAEVSKAGIVSILAKDCLWKVATREMEKKPLPLDEVLKYVKIYEESKKLVLDGNQTYKIELAYFPTTEDWRTATFTPVWWVHVPVSKGAAVDYQCTAQLGMNAYTGEIEFCWR